jgi:membrane protein implicated in regulation of membrane protease activity
MAGLILAIVAGVLVWLYWRFDRRRYRGRADQGQRPTGEVFRDPVTGEVTRVYEDPETGARNYRPDNH